MSSYHTYYLAKRERVTGMVLPSPPYDENGKMISILCRSRSCASDLYEEMEFLPEKEMSVELREQFSYESWDGELYVPTLRIATLASLDAREPFREAYVPAADIVEGLDPELTGFSDELDADRFAALCLSHAKKPETRRKIERFDEETGEYKLVTLEPDDYIHHAWVDRTSRDYESWLIATMAANLGDLAWEKDGFETVVLETEG